MPSPEFDTRYSKWIKEGRGTGHGKDYKPWLTVRDVPSQGRSHRVRGYHTGRTHHLLSDLELAAFFLLEWHPSVTDIREQFPLRFEDTLDLAKKAGIRHPAVRGKTNIMSTDFLVDTNSRSEPRMAIQVKTSSDLSVPRTIEKLQIEKLYWDQKEVSWYILTEKQVPRTVTKNIAWLYPAQITQIEPEEMFTLLTTYQDFFAKHHKMRISQAAMALDQAYSLDEGETLENIRTLMAQRIIVFNIKQSWSDLTLGDLQFPIKVETGRERHATNQ